MVRAGQMRFVVRVERRTTAANETGELLRQWVLVAERRCGIERAPGSEVWASAGRNMRVPAVLKLRYEQIIIDSFSIGETRALLGGKVYDVLSCADPDGLRTELVMTTKEHVEEDANG